jgi:diguanylate cyclase (GGDEF)-like protein
METVMWSAHSGKARRVGPDAVASRTRAVAGGFCLTIAIVTLLAARFGEGPGPQVNAFLPVCATLWASAEILTALLLFTQFFVTGTLYFAAVATAYVISGLLTAPYLAYFPGVFLSTTATSGQGQISIALWVLWHCTFPLVVIACHLFDPHLRRRLVPRGAIARTLIAFVGAVLVFCAAASLLVVARNDAIPTMVVAGHFTPFFSTIAAPLVAVLNGVGCVVLLRRFRTANALQTWLFVAMFTAFLDGFLNALAPARYSFAWYVGKLETLATATVVLSILLIEIAEMYRRTSDMAAIDALTGLRNRRTLDEYVAWAFDYAQRLRITLGLLVADIDYFKDYNDRYGHSAGEECLRAVAGVLRSSIARTSDIVARYGGEEFVVLLLPDTDEHAVTLVAERLRAAVEALGLVHDGSPLGRVTVSVGFATTGSFSERLDARRLFDIADSGLYEAKRRGRNVIAMGNLARATVAERLA